MATSIRSAAAVVWLAAADLALALRTRSVAVVGVTTEIPMYRRLNSAFDRADTNPHLPARFRDPRDVADSINRT